MKARQPENEIGRLSALRALHILDSPRESAFDDIVRIAKLIFNVNVVTLCFIDETRQWFKASIGIDISESPRDVAFCAHTIGGYEPVVVADTRLDPRFADNPFVTGEFGARAYAGIPLVTYDGFALGSLCVVDTVPREFSPESIEALASLARQASAQLELKRHIAEQKRLIADRDAKNEILKTRDQLFRTSLDAITEGFVIVDRGGLPIVSNKPALSLLGLSPLELHELPLFAGCGTLMSKDGVEICTHDNPVERSRRDGLARQGSLLGIRRGNGTRWLMVNAFPLPSDSGSGPYGVVATLTDMTEIKAAEEEHALLAAIVTCADDAVTAVDLAGTLISWNAGAERMYGRTEADVLGQHASILAPPGEKRFIVEALSRVALGETLAHVEVRRQRPDSVWITVSLTMSPITSSAGEITGAAILGRDITAQKAAEEQLHDYHVALEFQNIQLELANAELGDANDKLRTLAMIDGLTSLKNHRSFRECLDNEMRVSRQYHTPISVIMLDVDLFKAYNDKFGHPEGDKVLKRVAELISQSVRSRDTAARYGGEEFAVVLPEASLDAATVVAERIRATIQNAEWPNRPITVSVGVASATPFVSDAGNLVAAADRALYRAKAFGRNFVAVDGTVAAD
ncbi:MAG TPA: diguanylate cyclase [Capsulimonadaceae bacterium]